MLELKVAIKTHPACCLVSFLWSFTLTIRVFFLHVTGYFPSSLSVYYDNASCMFQFDMDRIPGVLYQPSHGHYRTRTNAVCTGTLTAVIRACRFLMLNRYFNPSTSTTYLVSLRTHELIVLDCFSLFFFPITFNVSALVFSPSY